MAKPPIVYRPEHRKKAFEIQRWRRYNWAKKVDRDAVDDFNIVAQRQRKI